MKSQSWIKEKQVRGLNYSLDFSMGFPVEDNTIKALFLLKTEWTKCNLKSCKVYSTIATIKIFNECKIHKWKSKMLESKNYQSSVKLLETANLSSTALGHKKKGIRFSGPAAST